MANHPIAPAPTAATVGASMCDPPESAPDARVPVPAELSFVKVGLVAMLVALVFGICAVAQDVLIPIVLALLFSLSLSPVVSLLERLRLPRALASALVLVGFVCAFAFAVTRLAQPARDWIAHAPETMGTLEQRFRVFREPIREAQEATTKIQDLAQPSSAPRAVVNAQPSLLGMLATNTPHVLAAIVAVLMLVYFFLASGNNFLRKLVEIAPRLSEKKLVVAIAREVQDEMSRYLLTVTCINVGLGIATALTMYLLDVPNPLLWGCVAAVLNFAPYVGPATTGFALLLVGFMTFDDFARALLVPGAFLALTLVEGQLITPTVIGRRFALDPTVVFIWLLLWGWLWGVVGLLLGGPLLACFRIVCQHVAALHAITILIGDGSANRVDPE